MTNAQKLKDFSIAYTNMAERERELFMSVVKKLLRVNYICRDLKRDRDDYYDTISFSSHIRNYFSIIDIDLIVDELNGVIGIKMTGEEGHLRLRLRESIFLLILRKLYYIKKQSLSLIDDIAVTKDEIFEELSHTGFFDKRMPKSEFEEMLRKFKTYHICDFNVNMGPDVVILLPSLLHIVTAETLDDIENKVSLYVGNMETEIDEYEVD